MKGDCEGVPPRPVSAIGENHRRGISTTLALLDELLCHVEGWVDRRERKGVLYEEENDLSCGQRQALLQEIVRIRSRLETARRDLGLIVMSQDAASDIWSRCTLFRVNIMELEGRHLRRYGEVAPDAEAYMNTLSGDLLAALDRLLTTLRSASSPP